MRILFLAIGLLIFNPIFSQKMDTIITFNKKITCKIKEISDENVKYMYPNEDVMISINKNRISKIILSSGRVESFVESSSFKEVNGWKDWQKVSITVVNDEIDGLYKIGDVSSKVKAGSSLSNLNKIKNKAMRKLKIRAAMMGANAIYMTSDHTEGHRYNGWTGDTNTAEVLLTGIAYTNRVPKVEKFKDLMKRRTTFRISEIIKMPFNKKTPTINSVTGKTIDLSKYTVEDGFVKVRYDGDIMTLTYIGSASIVFMKVGSRRVYNYILN